jgi:hypothetical protein
LSVRRKASPAAIDAAAKGYQAFRDKKASGQAIVQGVSSAPAFGRARRRLADLPISLRFLLPSIALLVVVMTATVTFIGHQITQTLNTSGEEELKQQVQLVQAMIASTFDAVERESSRLLDIYAARYPGTFTLDESKDAVPVLRHNKIAVNGQSDEEDAFAKVAHGPTATLLARRGDEFVRIATSQKNDKGERVVNTVLDKESPATAKLLAGNPYIGRTSSQGKDRVSALKPIKDETGKVIGAFGIGYFISDEMSTLRERVKAVKLGQTGYVTCWTPSQGSIRAI